MQTGRHIFFWIVVTIVMIIGFGSSFEDYNKTFYFVTFLMPVAMATSYFFNYFLVPRYLFRKRKFQFILYTVYTLIVSLFLQMVVITLSFIVIANYNYREMDPVMSNIFVMASAIYLVVFLKAFVLLYSRNVNQEHQVEKLEKEKKALKKEFITVRENRANRQILLDEVCFLESFGDYVQIHTKNGTITTKETLSSFESELPEYFIRIHRSYLVNHNFIDKFTASSVEIEGKNLPISRTYKKRAMADLKRTGEE